MDFRRLFHIGVFPLKSERGVTLLWEPLIFIKVKTKVKGNGETVFEHIHIKYITDEQCSLMF